MGPKGGESCALLVWMRRESASVKANEIDSKTLMISVRSNSDLDALGLRAPGIFFDFFWLSTSNCLMNRYDAESDGHQDRAFPNTSKLR